MKRLVLVGGGHAHLSVLHALARHRLNGIETILVTPTCYQWYSGMLPGWMAGHYSRAQCRIDLRPLCQAARVRLVPGSVVGLDAERRCVALSSGHHASYDLLSLDMGSETDISWLELLGERLLPVKPLEDFFHKWEDTAAAAHDQPGFRLVVVGGGAAGAEVALAARYAFVRQSLDAHVDLVTSESGLIPTHAPSVGRRVYRYVQKAGVIIHSARVIGTENGVLLSTGESLAADCVIAATGARPHCWLRLSKLALDEYGYVAVDNSHRSASHSNVFAAGDVCAPRYGHAALRRACGACRAGARDQHPGRPQRRGDAPVSPASAFPVPACVRTTICGGLMGTLERRRRMGMALEGPDRSALCGPSHERGSA
jgi:NADH dehydrogenase FAD-containing subunit